VRIIYTSDTLKGEKVTLRVCSEEFATQEYVNWLNDPQVNQFLETRFEKQTLKKVTDYVLKVVASDGEILFAMIENSQNKHIGNIHLTFNWKHKNCMYGYFIGDKAFWGKGIAVEAIFLATKWAFDTSDIERMEAGVYASNTHSLNTMIRAGFQVEAVQKRRLIWKDDIRDDHVWVVQFREQFEEIISSKEKEV